MKKKLLFKKEHISKLNQLSLIIGGVNKGASDSGYDPSDNTNPTLVNCNTNEQTCVACVSIHHSMCMIGVTKC